MSVAVRKSPTRARSLATDFIRLGRSIEQAELGRAWPSQRWANDPVGFAYYILGVELWQWQKDFLESIRDNKRTAASGGRKIGKDFGVAVASLWWYGTRKDARVFLTATNNRQVDGIAYLEIRKLKTRAGRCVDCKRLDDEKLHRGERPGPIPCPHSAILTGEMGQLARTGVTSTDFREIKGATSKDPEGMAGLSGAAILAIIDEASGYDEEVYNAIVGNLAANGCREVLISNPTRARGFFFDTFYVAKRMDQFRRFEVPSTATPNYIEGREVFPGLASREWVEERKLEWGEDSALYKVHVLGQFVLNEEGSIFTIEALAEACARWFDASEEGRLSIGVDPAGESGKGDESAFAARRGKKIRSVTVRRGLSPEGHLVEILGIIATNRRDTDREPPKVVVDSDGEVGARVYSCLRGYLETHPEAFDLVRVRGSDKSPREPLVYDRTRDALAACFRDWLRDGGAIPDDAKLLRELNAFRWVDHHASGKTKLIPKDKLREILERSPDRADACVLSCWHAAKDSIVPEKEEQQAQHPGPYDQRAEQTFDPYKSRTFGPGSDWDPYRR